MYYNCNKLYIIESLPEGDLKTGRILYEDVFRWHKENGHSFDVEYLTVKNIRGLELLFDIILSESNTTYIRPVIHLETHGNEDGIFLESEEIYSWNRLLDRLSEINYHSRNNLLLVLALCKGGYILSAMAKHITERALFFVAVYSFDRVVTGELLKGFLNFYNEIFSTGDGTKAMDKLCKEIKYEVSRFKLMSCVYIFKLCFENYMLEQCNRKEIQRRTENFITQLKQNNMQFDINRLRLKIKKDFKKDNQKDFFNFARDIFFMFDIYPENKEKLKLEFKDLEL